MRKLTILILCCSLLAGCVALPAFSDHASAGKATSAATVAAVTAAPVYEGTALPADDTPQPMPEVTLTPAPVSTEAPAATPISTQTYTGTYFRFDVLEDWLRDNVPDGVFFYPDPEDYQHTYLFYQEVPNDLRLTETTVDIALLFSSRETIAAMVEGALTDSGMTELQLPPMDIEKTKLNGETCYHGASDILVEGESYDFEGYIFLRGSKLAMLVWVGDRVRYADQLRIVYDSLQTIG